MNQRTAIRKKGRFIKKNDPLKNHIDVSDFNLMDICESNITYCDNPNGNIIHKDLHSEEEIKIIEESPDEISHVFNRKESRPIIRPINFTSEWEKIMEKQNSKHLASIEEDEIDNEMAEYAKQLREQKEQSNKGSDDLVDNKVVAQEDNLAEILEAAEPLDKAESSFEQEVPNDSNSLSSTLEEIRASDDDKIAYDKPNTEAETSEKSEEFEMSDLPVEEPLKEDESQSITPKEHEIAKEDSFVETEFSPIMNEEKLKELEMNAQKKGYEDGFIVGEEKGMLGSEHKISEIQQEFSNVIDELKELKKSVLLSAQENFRTIAQAMVESILEKEFQISDDAFGKFIQKAISETTSDDDFTILVSSQMHEKLKNYNSDIERHLKIDNSLEGSNFKIETKLGSVDGQVKKIISELLDKVDLNIIDNKAG